MRISDWSSDVCSSDLSLSVKRASALQFRQHTLKLHRVGHVALDLQLALHEGGHGVELALGERFPVGPADLDRRIGRAVFLGHRVGDAVEHDRALTAAEVELHPLAGNEGFGLAPLRSQEQTSELQSLMRTSYAVF